MEISDAALASRLSAFDGDYAMRSGRGPHDAPGHMVDVTLIFTSEAVARRALTNLGGGDRGRFRVVTPAWASAGAPAKGARETSVAISGDLISGDPISGDLGGDLGRFYFGRSRRRSGMRAWVCRRERKGEGFEREGLA